VIRRVVPAAVLAALAVPGAAQAHSGPLAPVATSFVARLGPLPAGVTARVVDGDQQLWLRVRPGVTVVVLGLQGEPYLRFDGSGVAVNERSPTAYLNRAVPEPVPAAASAWRTPRWRLVSHGRSYRWHEDRLHALALTARPAGTSYAGRWTIPLRIDGRAARLSGGLWHERSPSTLLWLWPALVAVLCVPALLRLRRRRLDAALTSVLAVAALAAIVAGHVARNLYGRPFVQAGQLGWLAFSCAFAGVAAILLQRPRWRPLALLATAAYALEVGLALLPVLERGAVLAALPASLDRVVATMALGAGGCLLVSAVVFRSAAPSRRQGRRLR
jgi:hypothetical protein